MDLYNDVWTGQTLGCVAGLPVSCTLHTLACTGLYTVFLYFYVLLRHREHFVRLQTARSGTLAQLLHHGEDSQNRRHCRLSFLQTSVLFTVIFVDILWLYDDLFRFLLYSCVWMLQVPTSITVDLFIR